MIETVIDDKAKLIKNMNTASKTEELTIILIFVKIFVSHCLPFRIQFFHVKYLRN